MILNFLKVTLRTLYREKVYATLNIVGLSIAIACCIIVGLYIRSELTYDQHHLKHKQIFRIIQQNSFDGNFTNMVSLSHELGPILKNDYPEVKDFVRFAPARSKHLFRYKDRAFYWETTAYADNSVFDVFTYKIIYGDPANALVDAESIAVSETFAKKYFGDENPVGKLISDDVTTYKISLVFADLPENTSRKQDVFLSHKTDKVNNDDKLGRALNIFYGQKDETYLLMPEDYDVKDFEKISESIFNRYIADDRLKNINIKHWKIWLQHLTDIHLDKELYGLRSPHYYLYAFSAVVVFILLVACINYVNLAIVRAAKRAKEVGMRKILGSNRKNLIIQFTGESIFFSLLALLFGLTMAEACLKLTNLNELIGKSLSLNLVSEPETFFLVIVISIVFGFLSGLYPALYLSSIKPASALTAGYKTGKYSIRLREALVVIQFIISVSIIACALLMFLQMNYISSKPLGFNKENRLLITLQGADVIDKVPILKNEFNQNKDVFGVSYCSSIIGQSSDSFSFSEDGKRIATYHIMDIDKDFIEVMGIEILSGANFTGNMQEDFIVNETLSRKLGWDQIGQSYYPQSNPGKLRGIVRDFHFYPLHHAIEPFMFRRFQGTKGYISRIGEGTIDEKRTGMTGYLVLNINSANTPKTIKFLEEKLEKIDPVHPFEFEFLDDVLNKMYHSEQNLMELIGVFAFICIFISCLGLFGLTAFSTEQRTKEIGTRKVLGATTWQVISMFSKRVLLLVLSGAVFASLAAYYAMDEWLTRFAYKRDIELWVFFASAAVVALLAFIAVAAQAGRAARVNPVEALRYE